MLLGQADRTFNERKYAEALDLYKRAAEGQDRRVQVEALAQVARCLSLMGKLEEGRASLARAEKLASKEEPLGWSRFLIVRGIFERESGDRKKAKETFLEAYEYCAAKDLHRRAVDAIHHVAIVVPPEEQPAWALKGIAVAEKLGDVGWLAVLWNNLGATHEDLKQYDKCLDAYLKAREYHHKGPDDQRKLAADWAVGHAYRLLGKYAEAREWLENTLAWAEKRHAANPDAETAEWVGWCKKDLGQVITVGDRAKGLAFLREARRHLVEAGIEKWWPEGLKELDEAIKKLE